MSKDPQHRYVVTFYDPKRKQQRRSRTLKQPSGIFGNRAAAEARRDRVAAMKSGGKAKYGNVRVVELKRPAKVSRWRKWTPQRAAQRTYLKARGFIHTSGDRTYNSLTPPKVSDHYEGRQDSWADDWWHPDYSRMVAEAGKLQRGVRGLGRFKQVLVHDAGSGEHLHVAGFTKR